jgi:ethanolamine utilization protein EutP
MQKTMLMGETGAGKTSLIKALSGGEPVRGRTMSVEFCGNFINTPGEFLENRRFYTSLITAAADCRLLLLLQDSTRNTSLFPPSFAAMFNRTVIGVITKIDAPHSRPDLAERFLYSAGARSFARVSSKTGAGLEELKALL